MMNMQAAQQQRQMNPQMMQQMAPQQQQMYGMPQQQLPMNTGFMGNPGAMQLPGQQLNEQLQNLSIGQPRQAPVSKEEKNKFPSLYVSNLPRENFFDLDFFKLITSQGFRLKSAKVALHRRTSKPLGYGYLQFNSKEEAERCLKTMNNFVLQGQALRIVPSVSKFDYNPKANLLVKNLDKEVTQQELYDAFRQYGDIQSCKLETYADGASKGYAYIQYQSEEEADKAIEGMNNKDFKGKKIEINKHEKKQQRDNQAQTKFNNLFVKNLPKGTDDNQLKELFVKYGEIESAQVQRDEQNNLKDYGYVCFKDPENAEAAMLEMNKKQIAEDQFLIVNKHISKKDNEPIQGSRLNPITQNLSKTFNSNIYVKFIPNEVSEEQLRKSFSMKDSNIVSIKLNKFVKKIDDQEVQPYQYAYILYDTVQGAQKAIQTYDQSTVFGPKPLLVELWVSKEEKEQERKKKESQQINQFISNILNLTRSNSYPPQNQQSGYAQGGPQGQMMPNQYNQRGGAGPQRGGNRGGRGGPRGGHRGGHMGGAGGHQQYAQRPPQQPGAFPQQQQQYNQFQQQQMPPQQYGMVPRGYNPAMGMQQQPQLQQIPLLPLPEVDLAQFHQISDLNERKQFVGNSVYPNIEQAFGNQFAGKITGMLIDENAVDFNLLLTNQQYFSQKAREAMSLLSQAQMQQPLGQPMQQPINE